MGTQGDAERGAEGAERVMPDAAWVAERGIGRDNFFNAEPPGPMESPGGLALQER
jgi:hypothetical protein